MLLTILITETFVTFTIQINNVCNESEFSPWVATNFFYECIFSFRMNSRTHRI